MSNIGIYGGSFSPPGLHHRLIAQAAAACFDNLFIIPCGVRSEKGSTLMINRADRGDLIGLNFSNIENVKVHYFDLEKEAFTPTWKIDIMYSPRGKVWHVIGPDLIEGGAEGRSEIHLTWQRGPRIWQELNFAVVQPADCRLNEKDLPPHHQIIPMDPVVGRSSQIRKLILNGQPFENLVLPEVAIYIKSRCLYGYQGIKSYFAVRGPARYIPAKYRCGRCKLDIRLFNSEDGCSCDRSHPVPQGSANTEYWSADDIYDGYGYYDYVRYLIDHSET
jgi:nicotinic acid mononucleotide adenylyltransferase